MKPRLINISLLDCEPSGIRVAQNTMSTMQANASRKKLGEVRKAISEIMLSGVNFLLGAGDIEPDRQIAFIGKSKAIGERLTARDSSKARYDSKDFRAGTLNGQFCVEEYFTPR